MRLLSGRGLSVALGALAFAAATLAGDIVAVADAMKPGEGVTVQPMGPGILRRQMEEDITNQGLRDLGYNVKPTLATKYALMYLSIANGDGDFTTGYTIPLHRSFYDKAGGDAKMTIMPEPMFADMVQAYYVDKKSYDAGVRSVEDLKKPENMKRFDFNNDGKADLVGCNPGWGCEKAIEHHLDVYKLRPHVTHIQGEFAVVLADAIARAKQGKPVLYYVWRPHWVHNILQLGRDVERLEVPFSDVIVKGKVPVEQTTVDGKNLGHIPWSMNIMANSEFLKKNPAAHAFLKAVRIPIEDIDAQNKLIYDGEKNPEDIKRHTDSWIANNRSTYDGWLKTARAAAK